MDMCRECREPFHRHQLQRKPLVSDPGMHRGTCVTHVPWCMPGSLTRRSVENVPGILGACATRNFSIWQEARGSQTTIEFASKQSSFVQRLINYGTHTLLHMKMSITRSWFVILASLNKSNKMWNDCAASFYKFLHSNHVRAATTAIA